MLKLKSTTLAILALGSSLGFAGTMGPVCEPGNVTVPCASNAWEIGIQALYLKTTYNANNSYAGFRLEGTRRVRNEFEPNWGWGFKLEGAYHFNTGNDLNVNWYHYRKQTTNSFRAFAGPMVGNINFSTSTKPEWDAVNFELGQHVDFGEFKDIRFHGGFQYAEISHTIHTVLLPTRLNFDASAKYKGFGPRIGADLAYSVGYGLSIYGNVAAALLLGDSKTNGNLLLTGGVLTTASKLTMVPELELKTGVKYKYSMAKGDLTFDAGYLWLNYFNAQHAITDLPSESNVGFTGPYAGVKLVW